MKQINPVRTINFKGFLTTIQPIAITTPDVQGMQKDRHGNPYIPATSLRGAIRQSAIDAVQSILVANNAGLGVDDIYMLGQGVDTARQFTKRTEGYVEIGANQKYRDANPHMSLYGRWGLKSRLHVGNAFSDKNTLVEIGGGARGHIFERNERLMQFVSEDELDYLSDILNADSKTSEELKDNKDIEKQLKRELKVATSKEEKDAINAKLEAVKEEMRATKDARVGASESIRRPIESFEAIAANVELSHSFRLASPSDDELYYFLWCLAMFSYYPMIGGHQAIGCGEIRGDWEVTEFVQGETKPRVLGKVSVSSDGFECDIQGFDVSKITEEIKNGTIDLSKFI